MTLEVIFTQEVLEKKFEVYGTKEEPLFLAKDVANWIEHNKPSEMIRNVDEDEKVSDIVATLGGNQRTWFLTEDGLYEVLMQSRKPIAKQFKKKVKAILKTLRRDGMYVTGEEELTETELILKTMTLLNNKVERLTLENAQALDGTFKNSSISYIADTLKEGKFKGVKYFNASSLTSLLVSQGYWEFDTYLTQKGAMSIRAKFFPNEKFIAEFVKKGLAVISKTVGDQTAAIGYNHSEMVKYFEEHFDEIVEITNETKLKLMAKLPF